MAGMDGDRHANWIDRPSFLGLLGLYVAVVIASPIVGALLFFFPILPFYELMGWEFSNLGPIATFFMGIMFDVYVVTPGFIGLAIVKLLRKRPN
jgi:hypothetical protein